MVVCASHIPAGQGKNHEPAPAVFPAWETENVQNNWVCDISDGMYCDQHNLKPNQAPIQMHTRPGPTRAGRQGATLTAMIIFSPPDSPPANTN